MMLLPSGKKINALCGVQAQHTVCVGAPAFIIHLLTLLSAANGENATEMGPDHWRIKPHTWPVTLISNVFYTQPANYVSQVQITVSRDKSGLLTSNFK